MIDFFQTFIEFFWDIWIFGPTSIRQIIIFFFIFVIISLIAIYISNKKLTENFNSEQIYQDINGFEYNSLPPKLQNSRRNLVFTSCGDNTNFHKLWCSKNRNYDVIAYYYGDNNSKYKLYSNSVDFIKRRKGSKFQNFHHFYHKYPSFIKKYNRFFILDDDIIFKTSSINKMFSLSRQYNLDICGPTFKNNGKSKISHGITIQKPNNKLRFVNFIEVNVPLFNDTALHKFMKVYDPILIGWGLDYLYIWANGKNKKNKYALIDSITCINPKDDKKNNSRELNNIKNVRNREQIWNNFKKKNNIKEWKHNTYSKIEF